MSAIVEVFWPALARDLMARLDDLPTSGPDMEAVNAKLAQLPEGPDEKLP